MLPLARRVSAFLAITMVCLIWLPASAQTPKQVETLGVLSFAVPDGWLYEYDPALDIGYLGWKHANGAYAVILLAGAIQSSGNAEKDFADAWRAEVEPDLGKGLPSPIYDISGMLGYPGKYGGASLDNRTREVWMYVLQTGAAFVPVVIVAPNREVIDALQTTLRGIIGGMRIAPLVAVPIKTTISVADLAGYWTAGDASVVSYVNRTTGAYAGSSTSFYGEYYTIAADGRYSYDFQGMSNRQLVREKAAGIVELGGEFVVFHEQPTNRLTRYRFISYEQGLAGGTLLTLLPEAYQATPSNIALYATRFAREPAQK
jgi:hypothetical protein